MLDYVARAAAQITASLCSTSAAGRQPHAFMSSSGALPRIAVCGIVVLLRKKNAIGGRAGPNGGRAKSEILAAMMSSMAMPMAVPVLPCVRAGLLVAMVEMLGHMDARNRVISACATAKAGTTLLRILHCACRGGALITAVLVGIVEVRASIPLLGRTKAKLLVLVLVLLLVLALALVSCAADIAAQLADGATTRGSSRPLAAAGGCMLAVVIALERAVVELVHFKRAPLVCPPPHARVEVLEIVTVLLQLHRLAPRVGKLQSGRERATVRGGDKIGARRRRRQRRRQHPQ